MSAVEVDGWFKACETSSCVEIKPIKEGALLRSSENPDVRLRLTAEMVDGMMTAIKTGAWNLPAATVIHEPTT